MLLSNHILCHSEIPDNKFDQDDDDENDFGCKGGSKNDSKSRNI